LESTYASNWHPVTWVSHMLDIELFGFDPRGHHLVNVLLHAVNAAVLFLALERMTGAPWRSGLVAALFAAHPLHVESVAWVAERKDLLSTFFWMLALSAWIGYIERPGPLRYLTVLTSFALGLAAKPMLVSLPFVLLLLDGWPLGRARWKFSRAEIRRSPLPIFRLVLEKLPFFCLAALSCALTWIAQARGGSVEGLDRLPLAARLANAVVSYAVYIWKTVWPIGLAIFYPHPGASLPGWKAALAAMFLLAVTAAVAALAKRFPYLPVGWCWYLGTLVPVIGLVQVGGQAMADRYTYVPLVGLFIIAAWGAGDLISLGLISLGLVSRGLRSSGPLRRSLLAGVSILVIVACVAASRRQLGFWRNNVALCRHAIDVTGDNWLAEEHLGIALDELGRSEEAIPHYRRTLGLRPHSAFAHNNLGLALAHQGRLDEAIGEYREALRYQPEFPLAMNNLAAILGEKGRLAESLAILEKALRVDRDDPMTHYNLGMVLSLMGKTDESADQFRRALSLKPDDRDARQQLGRVLSQGGRERMESDEKSR